MGDEAQSGGGGRTPLLVDLRDRRIIVVGGGRTAVRKIRSLRGSGARTRVIAPNPAPEIIALRDAGLLALDQRGVRADDVDGAWLIVTCTGNPEIDSMVARRAADRGIWCINAADGSAGTAALPAVTRGPSGESVAVSGAGDPKLAMRIRDAVSFLWELDVLPALARQEPADEPSAPAGRVALVGAGPGDPDLLTLRAVRELLRADVIVADRLAPRAAWERLGARATVIHVGKTAGAHPTPQETINRILVDEASRGQAVVRLKGGDPFMMGRGTEEALACIQAGIPVTIVPGISSALAVPAAAGIPVTTRGVASSFLVATAHDGAEPIDELVGNAGPTTTLVLMMAARQFRSVLDSLVEHGRDPSTPVAVIESGWTPGQKCWVGTLAAARAAGREPQAPAVVVVGDVVGLRPALGNLAKPSALAGHAQRRGRAAARSIDQQGSLGAGADGA